MWVAVNCNPPAGSNSGNPIQPRVGFEAACLAQVLKTAVGVNAQNADLASSGIQRVEELAIRRDGDVQICAASGEGGDDRSG